VGDGGEKRGRKGRRRKVELISGSRPDPSFLPRFSPFDHHVLLQKESQLLPTSTSAAVLSARISSKSTSATATDRSTSSTSSSSPSRTVRSSGAVQHRPQVSTGPSISSLSSPNADLGCSFAGISESPTLVSFPHPLRSSLLSLSSSLTFRSFLRGRGSTKPDRG